MSDQTRLPVPPPLDGSALCRRCGLCCDGTIHAQTTIRRDEAAALRAAGLPIEEDGERLKLRQPCVMYREAVCTIYSARPHACRSYRCQLLKAHESGTLSLEAAAERVGRARALKQAVVDALPPGETIAGMLNRVRQDWHTGSSPNQPVKNATGRWLLAWAALRVYLQKHFETPRGGG